MSSADYRRAARQFDLRLQILQQSRYFEHQRAVEHHKKMIAKCKDRGDTDLVRLF